MTDSAGKKAIKEAAIITRRTALDEILDEYRRVVGEGLNSKIIFPTDLLNFIKVGNYFDDADAMTAAVKSKNVPYKMAERGYEPVRSPYGDRWERGKFRSRTAYVAKTVPFEERIELIEAALRARPLSFEVPISE